jgi:hypothetical protein
MASFIKSLGGLFFGSKKKNESKPYKIPSKSSSILLDTLEEHRFEHNDQFSVEYDRRVHKKYYLDSKMICDIEYGLHSGNIGHISVMEKYQRKYLGRQMLIMAIKDIKNLMYAKEIYAFTIENHSFWTGIFNGIFKLNEKRTNRSCGNSIQIVCYSVEISDLIIP